MVIDLHAKNQVDFCKRLGKKSRKLTDRQTDGWQTLVAGPLEMDRLGGSCKIQGPVSFPFVQRHDLIFQQDNARVWQQYLTNHNIHTLVHNGIPLWRTEQETKEASTSTAHLEQQRLSLLDEWENIDIATINKLVNSTEKKRIRDRMDARGRAGTLGTDDSLYFNGYPGKSLE